MSSGIDRYDDEFQSLIKASLQDDDVDFTASFLSQCEDLLKEMSVSLQKVRGCKTTLSKMREEFNARTAAQDRANLMMGSNGSGSGGLSKESLLQAQSTMEQQNDTLDRARRIMTDMEDVALEITTELGRNRETLESAHGQVREVSGLTNCVRRLLKNMNRRAVQQQLAPYIIVIVVGAILWNVK